MPNLDATAMPSASKTTKRQTAPRTARAAEPTTRDKLLADPGVTLLLTRRSRQNLGGMFVVNRRIDLIHSCAPGQRDCWIKISYIVSYPNHRIAVEPGRPDEIEIFWSEDEARATWRYDVNTSSWAGLAYPAALAEHDEESERRSKAYRAQLASEEAQAAAKVAS